MTPDVPHSRRGRILAGAALVAAIAIIGGVAVAMSSSEHGTPDHLGEVKALVAAVPLPDGAVQVDAQDFPGDASSGAYAYRVFRLASPHNVTSEIVGLLRNAGYRPVDPQTGQADDAQWQSATTPTGGDVSVLPPGRSGDGINLNWSGRELTIRLQYGQVR